MQIADPLQPPSHPQQNLRLAVEYQQGGRFPEAEALYRQVLALYPGHPETLHRLGALSMQMGKPEAALPFLEQVKQIEPGNAVHWLLLTQCLLELNRPKEAKKVIAEAIRRGLRHPKADELLEQARSGRIRPPERTVSLKQEIAMLEQMLNAEHFAEAEARAQTFVRSHPKTDQGWHVLAMARMAQGRFEAALEPLLRAVQLKPGMAELHFKLGHSYEKLRRLAESAKAYRAALKLKPDFPEAQNGLLLVLPGLGNYEEALQVCRWILARKPDHFPALNNMALFLQKCGRASEAVEVYRRALAQGNDFAELHANYGNALKDAGRLDEALSEYRRAIALKPDYLEPRDNLIFGLNYREGVAPEELLAEARSYGEVVSRMATPFTVHDNTPEPDRRLRVGLVSGDLGEHSVGHFLEGVFANLDPARVELFAYSTAYHQDSALNTRLRACIPHWREATPDVMNDEALARQIHEDGIDILVDLSGHTGRNRLPVFAWKPAPVQVSWLGYLGTTGLEAMDYILADSWSLPVGEEDQFTETPWRLPDSYICFSPPAAAVEVGPLPALSNGHVTFGCFNNLSKVTDRVVACWAQLLQVVPESRLFLKSKALGESEVRKAAVDRFAKHGIDAGRLQMEGQQASRQAHFRAYQQIDIALDPFPYPGITTTVEGLWMGVPSVALKGDRFLSHQGESILNNAGLPDWIAENVDDYVAKAAAFARDLEHLSALRARLRDQVRASPLFDAPRFARNLEEAFRGMWRKWCELRR
ncbi:tetratricopeptide repeat protein [Thiobacillus sp.]